jgi:excisionase family DNA binding protein
MMAGMAVLMEIDQDTVRQAPLETDPGARVVLPGWAARVLDVVATAARAGEVVKIEAQMPTMTPQEMADDLDVSRATVMRRIEAGEITATRVGNRYRIAVPEVERFRSVYVRELGALFADDF